VTTRPVRHLAINESRACQWKNCSDAAVCTGKAKVITVIIELQTENLTLNLIISVCSSVLITD